MQKIKAWKWQAYRNEKNLLITNGYELHNLLNLHTSFTRNKKWEENLLKNQQYTIHDIEKN